MTPDQIADRHAQMKATLQVTDSHWRKVIAATDAAGRDAVKLGNGDLPLDHRAELLNRMQAAREAALAARQPELRALHTKRERQREALHAFQTKHGFDPNGRPKPVPAVTPASQTKDAPMALSKLALANLRLLRVLRDQGPLNGVDIANELARDPDNTRKTLKGLVAADEVAMDGKLYSLTDAARAALAAEIGLVAAVQPAPAAEPGSAVEPAALSGVPAIVGAQEMSIDIIDNDPELNPRTDFDEEALEELAAAIKAKGVLQPILVRPSSKAEGRFSIVAGERRWRACKKAGLTSLPVIVRSLSDDEALEIALMENIQRENLSYIEEAVTFKRIIDAKVRQGVEPIQAKEDVAEAAKKTVRLVEQRLDLLKLSPADQERIALPREHADHLSIRDARYKVQAHDRAETQVAEIREVLTAGLDLMMAEVFDKLETDPAKSSGYTYGRRTEIKGGDRVPPSLLEAHLLSVDGPDQQDGRTYVRLGYRIDKDILARVIPGLKGKKRDDVLHALRAETFGAGIADQVKSEARYATTWLNGPFEPDAKVLAKAQAARAKRDKENAGADAQRAAEAEAHALLYQEISAFEAEAPRLPAEAITARIAGLLGRCGFPAPWGFSGHGWTVAVAANGQTVPRNAGLAERVMIIAVNHAAGVLADQWPGTLPPPPAPPEPDLDRDAFVAVIAGRLRERDPDLTAEKATTAAGRALEAELEDVDLSFDDEDWNRTAEMAREIADNADAEAELETADVG